jgi:hypothetical protein
MRRIQRLFGRGIVLLICTISLMAMTFGCATLGPSGARGPAAVEKERVESSNGPIHMGTRGETCFIKCQDETDLGIDLRADIASALADMGIREVPREEDAVFFINVIPRDFFSGKGTVPNFATATGVVAGTSVGLGLAASGALRPGAAAAVGAGVMLLGAIVDAAISANTPNYLGFSVDVVIDELLPSGRSIQHKTVLTNWAKYMAHQATSRDAFGVVRANFARAIADMFR